MGMRLTARLGPVLLATVLGVGCDSSEEQNQYAVDAGRPAEGYTETNGNGEVVSDDPDDWRVAPFFIGKIDVEPARPNGVQSGLAFIPLRVLSPGVVSRLSLRVRLEDGRLDFLAEILDASTVGAYEFTFSGGQLPGKGLHRVFVFDALGEIVTYGDILVL